MAVCQFVAQIIVELATWMCSVSGAPLGVHRSKPAAHDDRLPESDPSRRSMLPAERQLRSGCRRWPQGFELTLSYTLPSLGRVCGVATTGR
jgi:hypothetical protein